MGDYPTEKDLKFLRDYDLAKLPVKPLIEFIQSIWWYPEGIELRERKDDFKSIKDTNDKVGSYQRYKVIHMHTIGWSGNEDIMAALEKNEWFFCFFWESSKRGGHYCFEINMEEWDKNIEKKNVKCKCGHYASQHDFSHCGECRADMKCKCKSFVEKKK